MNNPCGRFFAVSISLIMALIGNACKENDQEPRPEPNPEKFILRAADLSFLPEIEQAGIVFYNQAGVAEDMLTTLKNAGLNTVRIRLWKDPADGHSGFAEVRAFAQKARLMGLKVWLTVHYSDTWADPGHQYIPAAWQDLGYYVLKDSLYQYTAMIIKAIDPDYFQIGNEVNYGMLWPQGKISYLQNFLGLIASGAAAVRDHSDHCKIMIHYAGFQDAPGFFAKLGSIDYDIIGLSYYPVWHGKDLTALEAAMQELAQQTGKKVMIAETSYPFTFEWNDWTNNVTGSSDQILDAYPATPQGQKDFMNEIKRISSAAETSVGFAYWGGEWVAFKGTEATNGSSWENMAFYDFNFKALPVIDVFADD